MHTIMCDGMTCSVDNVDNKQEELKKSLMKVNFKLLHKWSFNIFTVIMELIIGFKFADSWSKLYLLNLDALVF